MTFPTAPRDLQPPAVVRSSWRTRAIAALVLLLVLALPLLVYGFLLWKAGQWFR